MDRYYIYGTARGPFAFTAANATQSISNSMSRGVRGEIPPEFHVVIGLSVGSVAGFGLASAGLIGPELSAWWRLGSKCGLSLFFIAAARMRLNVRTYSTSE